MRHLDGSLYPNALVDAQSLLPINGALEITTVGTDSGGAFAIGGLHEAADSLSVIQDDSLAVADTVTAPASGVALRLRPGVVLRGVALRPDTTDRSGVIVVTDLPTALTLTDSLGLWELRGVAPGLREVFASDLLSNTVATVAIQATAGDTLVLDTLRLHPGALPVTARMRLDAARRRLGAFRK